MHQTPKIAVLTMAVIVAAWTASAQLQWTVTGQEVPELTAIDEMIRQQMVLHDISASSIAITKNGRLVYARGYTWDQPGVAPVEPTSLFRSASIAKSITSIAIHQLIEDGLLGYETRVADTLGLSPPTGHSADPWLGHVTVDHLLTHTVGWDKYDGGIDPMVFQNLWVALALGVLPPPTRNEIATFMTGQPFQFRPGTRWAYCNFGYLLLQMLAEQATGLDFPEYINDNLFRAVGVGRARMAHSSLSDLAPTERVYVGDYEGDPYGMGWENIYAAGGIVLSAPDLARLYTALFDDPDASGLLRGDTIDAMLSLPFAASRDMGYGRGWIHERFFVDSGHTLGWLTDPGDGLEVFGHGGGGPGVHTIAVWRSDGIGFFWMSNKDPLIEDFDDLPAIQHWPSHDLWESVGIAAGPVGSAPAESWIPAVAHADGVGDSAWRSDVGLLNRSPRPNIVRLRYYDGWETIDREIELRPWEATVIADIVHWFERAGSGPLRVFSSEALTTTSRTYNQAAGGTFGQSMDSVTATGGLESGESVVLMQLREDEAARTNIGVHNQWLRHAKVSVELYSGDGSLITAHSRFIPPLHTVQLDRPFFNLGLRGNVDNGYAIIRVLSGQDVYVYGSLIDNATDDPTAIPMKLGDGTSRQWIAAASHADGARDSVWRTDLCLLNLSDGTANVELRYRGNDGGVATRAFQLSHGEQIVIEDVISELGSYGSGSIEVSSDRPTFASSRTYNDSTEGTYGLFFDGIPATQSAAAGDTVWLPQLRQDDAFRTNIGLVNSGDLRSRVRIHLFDASGAEVASQRRGLDPGEWLQLQEPFARLAGRTDVESGYARIRVEAGDGLIAFASVIDNSTNDGTAVVMKR